MILKIESAKGQEHFLPSKTKAMEGIAERETGSFNLLLLKVQLSIEGPPSLKFREFIGILFDHRNSSANGSIDPVYT